LLCFCHRYCLWILGNGTTLLASNSIWADLVRDSKRRGCFFDAFVDKDLAEAVMLVTKPEPWKQIEQVFWNFKSSLFLVRERAPYTLFVRHVFTTLIVFDNFLSSLTKS